MGKQQPPEADMQQQRVRSDDLGKEHRLKGEAAIGTSLWDVFLEIHTNI